MKSDYLNIYNNLIKLTTNKSLYKHVLNNQDKFGDRLTLFLLHFAFILKEFKNNENEKKIGKLPSPWIFQHFEIQFQHQIKTGSLSAELHRQQLP